MRRTGIAFVIALALAPAAAQAQGRGMTITGPLGADGGRGGGATGYDLDRAERALPPGNAAAGARALLDERRRDLDRARRQARPFDADRPGAPTVASEYGIGNAAIRVGSLLRQADEGMGGTDPAVTRARLGEARGLLELIRRGPVSPSDPNLIVLGHWLDELQGRVGR